MSIVVRDMEMPETCEDCPFHVYHSHYEYVCKATPMLYPMNLANCKGIRKDWCPLSEVPERKKGKWEIISLGALGVFDNCSECNGIVKHKAPFYNFCPNCGSDMRGDPDENN